ncbi:MAG: acetyltransferase [Oscillospiraceae bacterium]|nr:acetyltransferase [Oscillospiraceae bacterium]
MRKQLVLVGAGGFGREVAWQLGQINDLSQTYDILGFVDDSPETGGKVLNGLPVVGDTDWLLRYPGEISAVICVGSSKSRKTIAEKLGANPQIEFPNVIASDVRYSDTVRLGKGCVICLSNIWTVNITAGDFVVAGVDCSVGHDAVIGDCVTLHPSVNVSGNVNIGPCTEIGTGTNIIQGKKIGGYCVIGAGSVVIRDIPEKCTAVGVPAEPIKFHF